MMTRSEIVIAENEEQTAIENAKQTIEQAQQRLNHLHEQQNLLPELSPEIEIIACRCLELSGDWKKAIYQYGDARKQIKAAILECARGGGLLKWKYMARKEYDRWGCQAVNCDYGCGQFHSSVWLRIGLTVEKRKIGLTNKESNACVAFLQAILKEADADKQ